MKRSHTTAFDIQDVCSVLLAVAQHVPHVPATVPVAARLRTLSRWFRANAPSWPAVTGSYKPMMPLAFGQCAAHEHMPVVRWFTTLGSWCFPHKAIEIFAAQGSNDVMVLLLQAFSRRQVFSYAAQEAARKGKWETVQLLHKHGVCIDRCVGNYAAAEGRLDMVKWAKQNADSWVTSMTTFAAEYARMDVLEWLTAQGYRRYREAYKGAVERGNFDVVDWLRDHGYPFTSYLWQYAMGNEYHLEQLAVRACPWNEGTCSIAVLKGDIASLKWLRQKRCPWNDQTVYHAARNGKIEILEWAIANACPHDEHEVLEWAMKSLIMPMMQWAIDKGLIISHDHLRYFIANKAPEPAILFLREKMQEQKRLL